MKYKSDPYGSRLCLTINITMAFRDSFLYLNILVALCCVVGDDAIEDLSSHPGHLQPIGSHGRTVAVESLDHFPSPSVFFREYVNASKPLLIRGGAKISPAFTRWTDEYFLSLPEGKDYDVIVEQAKKENRSLSPEEIPFEEFVRRYREDDIYMVYSVPDFISQDVYLPPCLLCPDVISFLLAKLMWFSGGGTKSVLHYDSAENINCLFSGDKKFYLIDPNKYSDNVLIENKKSAYSNVDVERVDFMKYPGLKDVEYHHVEMVPGDCLYIPYHWFHHVSSIGRNIAVNVWWSPSAKPHLPDCNLPNTTLDQVEFRGFNELFARETIDGLKGVLKTLFKAYDNKVTLEQFRLYITTEGDVFEAGAQWTNEMLEKVDQIFYYLDEQSQDSVITSEEIKLLSEQTWNKILPLIKEVNTLVEEQFEPDSEDDDNFHPVDSNAEDDEQVGLKSEL